MESAYESEARHLSRQLGAFLRDTEPWELAVFTSDHGEEFFEHGGFKHGSSVYPEVSRVPLLLRGRGAEPGDWEQPVSLVHLKEVLSKLDSRPLLQNDEVTVESLAHGAPGWSWVHEGGQVILFARPLDPEAGQDALGPCLLTHHPAILFTNPAGEARTPDEGEGWGAVAQLIRHFQGSRSGLWILVTEAGIHRLGITGITTKGWWWGEAQDLQLVGEASPSLTLHLVEAGQFALVFLELGDGEQTVVDLEAGQHLNISDHPPRSVTQSSPQVWLDQGDLAVEAQGVEVTMERLRALGYI